MVQVNLYLVSIGTFFILFGSYLEGVNNATNGITFNNRRYIPHEITPQTLLGRILELTGAILISHAGVGF